jgi:hypothetical protein
LMSLMTSDVFDDFWCLWWILMSLMSSDNNDDFWWLW